MSFTPYIFVNSFFTVAVGRRPRGRLASHVSAVRPGQSTKHVTAGLAALLQVRLSLVCMLFLCQWCVWSAVMLNIIVIVCVSNSSPTFLFSYCFMFYFIVKYASLMYMIAHYFPLLLILHSPSRQSGEAIVGNKEPESQKTFVDDILTLQKKLDNVLKSAFFNQVVTVPVCLFLGPVCVTYAVLDQSPTVSQFIFSLPFVLHSFTFSPLHHCTSHTGRVQEWSEECIWVFHQLETQQLGLADRQVRGQKAQGRKRSHRTGGGAGAGPGTVQSVFCIVVQCFIIVYFCTINVFFLDNESGFCHDLIRWLLMLILLFHFSS